MNKKKIFFIVLILGLTTVLLAYKMYNKPHINVANSSANIILTANKIVNDFTSDENAANTKYLEKIIEVKGVISKREIENGKGIITLKTNDEFGSVLCHLSEVASKNVNAIKEGDVVSVKGICTGYLMDVVLVKCEIIN
ncbi:OB-fold protein [Polaribacter ponticola]|uniref:tRNA_anti-like n=1 Tax=Polaribacter ponticola TaxID=2978475 RepID=A0ABT5S4P8_9FLAO|nr:hypothetical protein [Polaribacter sp. MSW5]MDD7913079.1 hypothetical protein [Polaribacter sp. MSW5]